MTSTRCTVTIITPSGAEFTFGSDTPQGDLLSVTTHKDLNEACGSFTLQFAPRLEDGRTWAERIPMRSLVLIHIERLGTPQEPDPPAPIPAPLLSVGLRAQSPREQLIRLEMASLLPGGEVELAALERQRTADILAELPLPAPRPRDRTSVMVGITDDHQYSADYSASAPRQQVTVSGREISCILIDAELWYHHLLESDPASGTLSFEEFSVLPATQRAIFWEPSLAASGADPRQILRDILGYFLLGIQAPGIRLPARQALINLLFTTRPLSSLLDLNSAAWTTFEPVTVPVAQNAVSVGSLWNYLHLFIDRFFQEFFTRVEDGVCRVYFRAKPFRTTSTLRGSRFLPQDQAPTCRTLRLTQTDILTQQLHRSSQDIYNVFWVYPLGTTLYANAANFQYRAKPVTITNPQHPSFVGRYGIRVLQDRSPYLSPFPADTAAGTGASLPQALPTASADQLSHTQQYYANLAVQIAKQEGLPDHLIPFFVANLHQESNFNPRAVSRAGAKGIAQFIDSTAAAYGVTDSFDPVQSMHGSARYWLALSKMNYIGNDPGHIAAAYNAGEGAVQRVQGNVAALSAETIHHVAAVLGRGTSLYGGIVSTAAAVLASPIGALGALVTSTGGAVTGTGPDTAAENALIQTAERWAKILRAWYDVGGLMASGTFTLRGDNKWNIGHRLLTTDVLGDFEAYVEGVGHTYDFHTGLWRTTLRITRGWYLSAQIEDPDLGNIRVQVPGAEPLPSLDIASISLDIGGDEDGEVRVSFPDFPVFQ